MAETQDCQATTHNMCQQTNNIQHTKQLVAAHRRPDSDLLPEHLADAQFASVQPSDLCRLARTSHLIRAIVDVAPRWHQLLSEWRLGHEAAPTHIGKRLYVQMIVHAADLLPHGALVCLRTQPVFRTAERTLVLFSSEEEALTDCVGELLQKWRAQAERTTFGQAWAARSTDYFIYRFPDPSTAGAMLELALSGCPLRCEFAPNPCYDTVSWGSAPMIDLRRPKVPTEPLLGWGHSGDRRMRCVPRRGIVCSALQHSLQGCERSGRGDPLVFA